MSTTDLVLKLRFKRILFLMGYYSPLEVELSHYQDTKGKAKRTTLTDLDVLGIRYDSLLVPHKIVADCKSGKHVSDSNRLFWLRGVADYFGADVGYYIRPKIDRHARAMAPKLGLRVLDERDLLELETNLNAKQLTLPLADPELYNKRQELWGIGKQEGKSPNPEDLVRKHVYSYLSYLSWSIEQYRNLFQLIHHFTGVAHLLKADSQKDVVLAYAGLERFALCLLEIGSDIHNRGVSNILGNARVYLYGGHMALRERERFFSLLRNATGSTDELDPPYLADIIEVVNRMIRNHSGASKLLPYLEAIFGCHLLANGLDPNTVFDGKMDIGAVVLARDMCNSFCRSTGLSNTLYTYLLDL